MAILCCLCLLLFPHFSPVHLILHPYSVSAVSTPLSNLSPSPIPPICLPLLHITLFYSSSLLFPSHLFHLPLASQLSLIPPSLIILFLLSLPHHFLPLTSPLSTLSSLSPSSFPLISLSTLSPLSLSLITLTDYSPSSLSLSPLLPYLSSLLSPSFSIDIYLGKSLHEALLLSVQL